MKIKRNRLSNLTAGRSLSSIILPVLLLLVLLIQPCSCSEIYVGKDGINTIGDAVSAASEGDVIYIDSGKFDENIVIDRKISLVGLNDPVIAPSGGDYCLILAADGITVNGLVLEGGADTGIIIKSSLNLIENNRIYNFPVGIMTAGGKGNIFTGNEIAKNEKGLVIEDSEGLEIYRNDFIDNRVHAVISGSSATWTSNVVDYSYGGNSYSGFLGNYWSGYSGSDENGDGIGDKPYTYTATGSAGMRSTSNSAGAGRVTNSNLENTVIDKAPLMKDSGNYFVKGESVSVSSLSPAYEIKVGDGGNAGSSSMSAGAVILFLLLFIPASALSVLLFRRYAGEGRAEDIEGGRVKFFILSYFIAGIALIVIPLVLLSKSGIPDFTVKSPEIPALYFIWIFSGTCSLLAGYSLFSGRYCWRCFQVAGIVSSLSLILSPIAMMTEISGDLSNLALYVAVFALLSAVVSVPAAGIGRKKNPVTPAGPSGSRGFAGAEAVSGTRMKSGTENFPSASETENFVNSLSGISETTYFPQSLYQRYSEVSYVGMGGIARVFKGKRNSDGMTFAIKIPINFDENTGKLFIREMRVWENLEHPNIVKLYSFNILPVPFVEMEYIQKSLSGFSLPLSQKGVLRIVRDISLGLSYAHKQGIIHRDIKPHNILVTDEGVAKVTDWGLAKLLDDRHESTVGGFSLYYAAPEQLAPDRFGKPDERTDIYQIGVLVYELLIGLRPFTGGGVADITDQILYGRPMAPSENRPEDAPFDYLVMKCLEKNPENRFGSVDEILEVLDNIARQIKGDFSENDLFS